MAKNVLHRKLLRDMHRSNTQFIALILLCVLGTFLFTGIDGISRMAEATNRRYFADNRLADFWISLPRADRQALIDVRSAPGVEAAQARFSLDMEADLPGKPSLNVTAYDGPMEINVPLVAEGLGLEAGDRRGCLMQVGFARANGVQVGDTLTLRYGNTDYETTVRGLIYSPEFISVTDDFAANPLQYGFVLVNAAAFPDVPLSQIVARLQPQADQEAARRAILAAQPLAFVQDRATHKSTATANDNVTMFHSLSIVFPMAAFVVAALIVMTTLTRMIDNQRMQIGALRSLGFSNRMIRSHYLSYAVMPSVAGSVLGAVLGHFTLPDLVWRLLIGQNEYPYRIQPPISLAAWIMVGVSVVTAVAICWITYGKAAKETAADLLRPKPPKAGKRVLLERIPSLWKRLGFNQKMVVRNLMRVKSRTMMSCVGLLSCCALLIASIGLQDSVYSTVYNLYGGTLHYDLRARLDETAGSPESYRSRLPAGRVESLMERPVDLTRGEKSRTSLLSVLEDDQELMCLGADQSYVPLTTGTAALTDKLARLLNVQTGDTVSFLLPGDDQPFVLTVGQIVFNNFSQGAYINRATWEGLRKGSFVPSALLIRSPAEDCLARLTDLDEVKRVDTIQKQAEDALVSLQTVSSIFYLLMFIALALAFVICYNMGLINFAERMREYATLKVLGYHQKEIRGLILRENVVIALIALVLAVVPGLALTDVILRVVETDSIRYIAQVPFSAVAISWGATFVFSIFIQLVLVRKVKSLQMVEALKSVE